MNQFLLKNKNKIIILYFSILKNIMELISEIFIIKINNFNLLIP